MVETDKSGDIVYGVVYNLNQKKLEVLTKYEGKPPRDIAVDYEEGKIKAKAYIFRKDKPPLRPAPMYVETIIKGLQQHCYGEHAIEAVRICAERYARFSLFSEKFFRASCPVALIEAYCFQSNFYAKYDLQLKSEKRNVEDVNLIGARINRAQLPRCKAIMERHKHVPIFGLSLDDFLKLDDSVKEEYIRQLSVVVGELVAIKGIGFSKATKILHTIYPQIIPIIDSNLQQTYQEVKQWKSGNWGQILMDYYDNFLVEDTYQNLCRVHNEVSHLGLTKVRVFDILWWSYLKSRRLRKKVDWTTISRLHT